MKKILRRLTNVSAVATMVVMGVVPLAGQEYRAPRGPGGMPDLTPVAVIGPPEVCAEGLRAVADAGAERILLNPMFDEAEQMERLVAEVVPKVS